MFKAKFYRRHCPSLNQSFLFRSPPLSTTSQKSLLEQEPSTQGLLLETSPHHLRLSEPNWQLFKGGAASLVLLMVFLLRNDFSNFTCT